MRKWRGLRAHRGYTTLGAIRTQIEVLVGRLPGSKRADGCATDSGALSGRHRVRYGKVGRVRRAWTMTVLGLRIQVLRRKGCLRMISGRL